MNEIEEVKARLDVVDVVGQYVQLQKAGRSYKALCPFHTEKTPSFIVSPERQSWHCFGACGTGGDVFSFVMRKEGLEFGQALRLLAEKAGVKLSGGRRSEEEDGERQRLLAANEAATQWYHHLLLNSESAKGARGYVERRGIDTGTAESFALGYSLDSWEGLRSYLGERGFSDAELASAGLLVEGESGLHDRFRGRLMFPIRDVRGRVIGFGARALDDSLHPGGGPSGPKYLNTSQTAIFDKGSTLYGLDRAGEAIRREGRAVIVEGYMDVIAAHQHGFEDVVATMGTALTERQVRLVKRHARSIVLALDADQAGSEAALRGHEVVQEALRQPGDEEETVPVVTFWRGLVRCQEVTSVDLRVAVLPEGRDPDDVIRGDAEAWRELVASARPLLDHRFEVAAGRHDLSDPRGRSEAVGELMPLLSALIDPVVRQQYLQRLSRLALVRESELATMLARSRSGARGVAPGPERSARRAPARPGGDGREEFLLALLLRHPELGEDGREFPDELLWGSENRELLQAWREADDLDRLRESLSEELATHLERLLERRLPEYDQRGAREALADCRRRLERRQLETEKQLSSALLAAEEEELGPSTLVEAAVTATDVDDERIDERMKEAVGLHLRDMETGLRLHRPHRRGGGGETDLPVEGQD